MLLLLLLRFQPLYTWMKRYCWNISQYKMLWYNQRGGRIVYLAIVSCFTRFSLQRSANNNLIALRKNIIYFRYSMKIEAVPSIEQISTKNRSIHCDLTIPMYRVAQLKKRNQLKKSFFCISHSVWKTVLILPATKALLFLLSLPFWCVFLHSYWSTHKKLTEFKFKQWIFTPKRTTQFASQSVGSAVAPNFIWIKKNHLPLKYYEWNELLMSFGSHCDGYSFVVDFQFIRIKFHGK